MAESECPARAHRIRIALEHGYLSTAREGDFLLARAMEIAYIRGRYAVKLRPKGARGPLFDQGAVLETPRKEPAGVTHHPSG